MYALKNKNNENVIKLLINNKTDLNKKNYFEDILFFIALENKCNEKIIKLMINDKTDINQKTNFFETTTLVMAIKKKIIN